MSIKSKRVAGTIASLAVGLGLLGGGVYATYSQNATATDKIKTGTLACSVATTADPSTVVVNGNSLTINNPDITSSAPSNYQTTATVTNNGTIPMLVHWTVTRTPDPTTAPGNALWQPGGDMGYAFGDAGNPMSTDVTLAPGATSAPYTIGFQWAELGLNQPNGNAYMGQAFQLVYTANCGEKPVAPPPPTSKIVFVAANSGIGAVSLPNTTSGNIAVVEGWSASGTQPPGAPSGYTLIGSLYHSSWSYRVLTAGDTTVPATGPAGSGQEVAVYSGVAGVGAFADQAGNSNQLGGSAYPLKCPALSLQNTTGSSWVMCMGYDGYTSTNARSMVFDSNTTNRSASLTDIHTGLADTNAPVSSWASVNWTGDNFPLPGSHAMGIAAIELKSS